METIKRTAIIKIDLSKMTEEQVKAFWEAEQKLNIEAGVKFDTGMGNTDGVREWFFDETTNGLVKTEIETTYQRDEKITKDIVDGLLMGELRVLDDILDALEKLKLIDTSYLGYGTESDAWCWFEREPSHEEKLKVLATMGYDISRL